MPYSGTRSSRPGSSNVIRTNFCSAAIARMRSGPGRSARGRKSWRRSAAWRPTGRLSGRSFTKTRRSFSGFKPGKLRGAPFCGSGAGDHLPDVGPVRASLAETARVVGWQPGDTQADVAVDPAIDVIAVFDNPFHHRRAIDLVDLVMQRRGPGGACRAQAVRVPLRVIGHIHRQIAAVVIHAHAARQLVKTAHRLARLEHVVVHVRGAEKNILENPRQRRA